MIGEDEIVGRGVVCALATVRTPFDDNLRGDCHFCHRAVQYRPNVPRPHTLICNECFLERVEDGDEAEVPPSTLLEALAYFDRN